MASLKRGTIKRSLDETACDWCGRSLLVGEPLYVDLEHGTAYCSHACAELDHCDRGYCPVCPSVSRW
jgi:hypothetical protein